MSVAGEIGTRSSEDSVFSKLPVPDEYTSPLGAVEVSAEDSLGGYWQATVGRPVSRCLSVGDCRNPAWSVTIHNHKKNGVQIIQLWGA
jgi:hypothetical protein